jgi:sirohydrochlorin ferrochelatase
MAHGGSPEWNDEVLRAVEPLRAGHTIEVAFGMADPATIQEAALRLEALGVRRIGVVRLFISGESWYERTEQILGLRGGAPSRPAPPGSGSDGGHGDHNHSMELWRAETAASFALTTQGLAEAEAMGTVLADRARALSRDPRTEDVLILAHGPGDDSENERWIATIDARAEAVRQSLPFRRVQVVTLREDWPEKRPEAERRIRAYVERARAEGGAAIVIPFRVQGFGPYAQVLDGLEYVSDGHGLMPHPGVTRWIEGQIMALRRGPFRSPID